MSDETADHVAILFERALQLSGEERRRFLDDKCGADLALRSEIESLLGRYENHPDFLENGIRVARVSENARVTTDTDTLTDPPQIGSYRIKRRIGEGAWGIVYEAEQARPQRPVALKIIRPERATNDARRRFEREAALLARLQHPGIAQIFEAGTADISSTTGEPLSLPFIAMEYIEGRSLDQYRLSRSDSPSEHISLVASICDAVEHAHQRSIIHRDLKPRNILIDNRGTAKVLDFGIAILSASVLDAAEMRTRNDALAGTIPYMSPEQLTGEPDTRSDIYALGVILYELLAKRLPYPLEGQQLGEQIRIICNDPPLPLSRANHALRGDIEVVVEKALQKDPNQRYQTATALAEDLRRILRHEPVAARRSSKMYRFRKWILRESSLAASLAVATLTLIVGTWVAVWLAVRATRAETSERTERIAAQRHAARSENAMRFLGTALTASDPWRTSLLVDNPRQLRVVELLAALETSVQDIRDPAVEASVRTWLGTMHTNLGAYEQAETHLPLAVSLAQQTLGQEHIDTLSAMYELGALRFRQGQYNESDELFEYVLTVRIRTLGKSDTGTLQAMIAMALLREMQNRLADALNLHQQAYDRSNAGFGQHDARTIAALHNLSRCHNRLGHYSDAEQHATAALELSRTVLKQNNPLVLDIESNLAAIYVNRGKYSEAEPLLLGNLEAHRKVFGSEHPGTLTLINNLAIFYGRQGEYDRAEPLLREVVDIGTRVQGAEHPDTLIASHNVAQVLLRRGRLLAAREFIEPALDTSKRVLGDNHLVTGMLLQVRGAILVATDDFGLAELSLLAAYRTLEEAVGTEHPYTQRAVNSLAGLYDKWGKPDQAATWRTKQVPTAPPRPESQP